MNVLIVDIELMGLDFALRCADAGHDVRLYRHTPKRPERYGDGFKTISLVTDWRASMDWAREGLIVLTGNYALTHDLARYKSFGYPVFAPSPQSARLEIDRMAGMKAARAAGIAIPECHEFGSMGEAEAFARKADRPFVFKPGGDEENKALTYVSRDPADMVGWLRRQIAGGKQMKQCILQEKIDMLAEIGVSGWCGPEGFLPDKWQVCFEHKKLMDGETGPATGEMGTVCQYVETDKLADETLRPMETALRTLGHVGDFSFGGAVDTSGKVWFFEWTARFGYPAWWIQMASHKGDPARWMKALLEGRDELRVSYDVAIGVVCAQPPFPHSGGTAEQVEGHPIAGAEQVGVHLASVMLGRGPQMAGGVVIEGPQYQTSAAYVLVCTGLGKSIKAAQRKVYAVADEVHFPDKMMRGDIGDKVIEALPELHRFGYAVDMR